VSPDPQPLIWTRLSNQGRGPVRTLDHVTITDAAVAIADEEGLEAVSIRKIAGRIDRSAMSLYRHIDSKNDVYELMFDAVLGELDLPARPAGPWSADLAALMRDLRRMYLRHPWMSRLGRRPSLGPHQIRLLEYGLACVDEPGRDVDAMLDLFSTALQFTQGFVQAEIGAVEVERHSGMDREAYRRYAGPFVSELLKDGQHPYLRRMIVEAEDDPDPDAVFERRLAMVLAGLEAAVGR
jgi:AcrR family transcriptional regulator